MVLWAVLALVVAVTVGVAVVAPVGLGPLTGLASVAFGVVALVYAVKAARSPALPPRIRRSWRVMTVAYALFLVTLVLFPGMVGEPFPSVLDAARVAVVLALVAGLWSFARASVRRTDRLVLVMDAGLVVAGAAMVLWYVMISPALAAGDLRWRTLTPALVYPLCDVLIVFAVAGVMLRGAQAAARRPMALVAASAVFQVSVDVYRGYLLQHGLVDVDVWTTLGVVSADFLLMLAAVVQVRVPARGRDERPVAQAAVVPRWTYLAVIPGYALLVAAVGVPDPLPAGGLIAGTIVISGLVIGRQVLAAQQTRRMATTDSLTGLANRARLYPILQRVLARGRQDGTTTGVLLLDLNGFKQVNDTLGHHAGDELLTGFAGLLRRSTLGSDTVARLGGDEFVVVLTRLRDAGDAVAVARRIVAATAEPLPVGGTLVQARTSIGVAVTDGGPLDADELLHRADAAMYQAKRAGTSGWHVHDDRGPADEADLRLRVVRHPGSGRAVGVAVSEPVLRAAVEQAAGHGLWLSVPKPPSVTAAEVGELLAGAGLPADRLVLLTDPGDPELTALRALGVRIAHDDRGTGAPAPGADLMRIDRCYLSAPAFTEVVGVVTEPAIAAGALAARLARAG